MLEIRDLSVSYGQHRALEGAALRVGKGEIVVILGANGAGKSTLLKAVCGICEGRATGAVVLGGEDLMGAKPHHIVEAGIALVPEGRGVFGDLTVEENLTLGAYSDRARDDEAGNLDRVLSLFPKLAERRRQTVRTMSGGEQQMVAIGRAMMSNPQILALDEPSLGLSPLLCKDLFQSLRAVRQAGLGILLIEQNARQSLRIADRGYLLENGAIVHEDTAEKLANDTAVQKAYLGGSGTAPRKAAPVAPPKATPPRTAQVPAPQPKPVPPRPASGPTPGDIAAAALRSVAPPRRPDPAPAPAPRPNPEPQPAARPNGAAPPPARAPAAPDIGDLVARASATASRRPSAPLPRPALPPAAPPPSAPPMSDPGSSADRLRAVLDDIETAARRAETYKPGR